MSRAVKSLAVMSPRGIVGAVVSRAVMSARLCLRGYVRAVMSARLYPATIIIAIIIETLQQKSFK
jgi:hypothetical protein